MHSKPPIRMPSIKHSSLIYPKLAQCSTGDSVTPAEQGTKGFDFVAPRNHSHTVPLASRMKSARKWWTWNATMVALALQVALNMTSVSFIEERVLACPCAIGIPCVRPCRKRSNLKTANESSARGFFAMAVVVILSLLGFSSYWKWTRGMSLTLVKVAPSDYRERDGAFDDEESKSVLGMEAVVSYVLSLLLTLSAYLHRSRNGPRIRELKRNFRTLYRRHLGAEDSLRWAKPWDRYGRLLAKQTVEIMALGVLWLNLRPFNDTSDSAGEDYRVGKLISSLLSMLPSVVCLLVSAEMGIHFSFIVLSLTALNRSLDTVVQFAPGVDAMANRSPPRLGRNCRMIESMRNLLGRGDYLRYLIMQYDELGDVALSLVEFHAPILLLIIGMHFFIFTLQLFLCYREMSRSTSGSVCVEELGQILLSLLSVFSNAVQIIFVVDTTAAFNRKLQGDTMDILTSLTKAVHERTRANVDGISSREIDQSVAILSLVLCRIQSDTNLYGYFNLDRSLVMTIVVSTCSYLIVLIQVL